MAQEDQLIFEQITQAPNRQRIQWTAEENIRFLDALHKFGRSDARAISQYVGTRTPAEIHSHAQKHQARLDQLFAAALCDAERGYLRGSRYLSQLAAVEKPYYELSRVRFPVSLQAPVVFDVLLAGCQVIEKRFGMKLICGDTTAQISARAADDGDCGLNNHDSKETRPAVKLTSVALLPEGILYQNVQGALCFNAVRLRDTANAFLLGLCAEEPEQNARAAALQALLFIINAWKQFATLQQSYFHKVSDIAAKASCSSELVCAAIVAVAAVSMKD